jgi:hypothetical protein
VKVVKLFSPTFETGGIEYPLRETWRKSLHNLHNIGLNFSNLSIGI